MTPDQLTNLLLLHPDPVSVVVELAKTITRESVKAGALSRVSRAVKDGLFDTARAASRLSEWGRACRVVRGVAQGSVGGKPYPKGAWATVDAAADLAGACVVRDLITYDQMHVLVEAFHRHLPVDESVNQC